jgi:HD-GYP domain-containing protein (c-di-GMP phosphodiesterase class II)
VQNQVNGPIPSNETERLAALRSYEVLDTSPEEEFDSLTRLAGHICGTPMALVTLVDSARQWFKSKTGIESSETPRDVAFCSHTILQSEPLVVPNALEDPRFATNPLVTSDPNIRFYCGVSLRNEAGFGLGSLCVIDREPRHLNPEQVEALKVLGRQVMAQLELKRAMRELGRHRVQLEETVAQRTKQLQCALKRVELTYDETLEALGAALDLRDNETAGHSRRVTRYCLEIAKVLGCEKDELKHLERGSYLHDIGKIGIPDAILLKPGRLDPVEREVMDSHVRIGYDIVSRVTFLARPSEIVLTHQERFDGTGYPQGLIGKEIPLGARIFSVADTLDAITSDRPYRRALPFSEARNEIVRCSGVQFDPDVVQAFLSIPEETWKRIRSEVGQGWQSLRRFGETGMVTSHE